MEPSLLLKVTLTLILLDSSKSSIVISIKVSMLDI
jgi:hypothetical protein